MTSHLRGTLMVTAGTLCLVPDASLIRLADAGDWEIVFWRSLFVGLALVAVLARRHRGRTVAAYRTIGPTGLLVGGLWGLGLILFVYSINHTAVANTLVIVATAPFVAALFTRLLIGETIRRRTGLAMVAVTAGVTLTFASALAIGGLPGNLAAVGVAGALGLNLTLIRRASGIDMLPAISLAGFIAAAATLPAAWPAGMSGRDFVVVAVMGVVLVPAAFTLLTLGTRHLTSPEVTLLMTLETVLGPLLAWAVIHERPPALAIAGGAVVVGTLALHSLAAFRAETAPLLEQPGRT